MSEQTAEDRETVAAIIHDKCCPGAELVRGSTVGNCRRAADAVLAALDVPALRAEVERLRQGPAWRTEAIVIIAQLRAERDALAAQVEKVRALHARARSGACMSHCDGHPVEDYARWPCPTVAALDETGRCQHVSPSPWGLAQCALEADHEERHAYSPSEALDETGSTT